MKPTETDHRALALLRARPMTCTELGEALWRKPGQRVPPASQGGNKWTRNAGKVTKRLAAFGLAHFVTRHGGHRIEWRAT